MRLFYAISGILGIAAILGSSACNLINPAEVVPTYVHIDSFSFPNDPTRLKGTSSHKITSVFVYFNNAPVGIFDLPVTFPVIATAPGTLTVLPGVDFDGLSGYQSIYALYTGDTMRMDPAPGGTIHYTPDSKYGAGTVLQSNEEFEQGIGTVNSFTWLSGDTGIYNITTPSEVFEGSGSGLIRLVPGRLVATVTSRNGQNLAPSKGSFLELNYKGNMPLLVGMSMMRFDGSIYQEFIIGLKERPEWGKIYISLDEFIGNNQGSDYKIVFRTEKPDGVSDGFLYLDNVKVVSF